MFKFFHKNFISYLLLGILVSSCNSKKENFDLDLSNFKIPKKNNEKILNIESPESLVTKKEIIKNELKNYQNKSEILSSIKLGKIDPFSEEGPNDKINNLNTNFKLTGFLNTKNNKYVFVSYLGQTGTITEESIGGKNTNLLPNGAKVLKIDPKKLKLIINFENKDYIIEL